MMSKKQIRAVSLFLIIYLLAPCHSKAQNKIDRHSLVQRHNVININADSLSSLSVGNGSFAFTVDITGFQSFPDYYKNGVPLGTESEWGWHSFPNTENLHIEEAQKTYELEGRKISYTVQLKEPEQSKKAVEYFRVNQHRLQLGNIGLEIIKKDGWLATIDDIKNIKQELDLWKGIISSYFTVEDVPVKVITLCDQQQDALAFKIESALLKEKRLQVRVRFPYPNGQFKDAGNNWQQDSSQSSVLSKTEKSVIIKRTIDTTEYFTSVQWSDKADVQQKVNNYFVITPNVEDNNYELVCRFSQKHQTISVLSFNQIQTNSIASWKKF